MQLDSPTQKEVTPGPAATQGDTRAGEEGATQGDIGAGEETQEVELVVAETDESEGQKTPDVESDVEREKDQGQG